MTTEMGPREVDLGWHERLAGRMLEQICPLLNAVGSDPRVRFRRETATVSITGESEDTGNAYRRGIMVALLFMINILVWLIPLELLSQIGAAAGSGVVMWAITAILLPLILFTVLNALGSASLLIKTDVVDHTTEPAPDALDELQQQYVDGEIDEAELDERAGEVWER